MEVVNLISGVQIRCARAALTWSIEQLASESKISVSTIKRMEATDDVPKSTAANIKIIRLTLEAAGIEFIGSPDDRPGIRFNPEQTQK